MEYNLSGFGDLKDVHPSFYRNGTYPLVEKIFRKIQKEKKKCGNKNK